MKWFVFLLVPIVPLGTYRVIKAESGVLSTSTRYLMEPVPTDRRQILTHLAVGWSVVALVVTVFRLLVHYR